MSVLARSDLEASPLADLHVIASELGLDSFRRMRKADLIDAIVERQGGDADEAETEAAAQPEAAPDAEPDAEEEREPERPRRRRRGGGGRARPRPARAHGGAGEGDAGAEGGRGGPR